MLTDVAFPPLSRQKPWYLLAMPGMGSTQVPSMCFCPKLVEAMQAHSVNAAHFFHVVCVVFITVFVRY